MKSELQCIGLCLKTFDRIRTRKILSFVGSKNLEDFNKYGKVRFKLSDSEGGMVKYLDTLESENNTSYISRGHYELINSFIKLENYKNMHGEGIETTFCDIK